jgi:hypothetical protein
LLEEEGANTIRGGIMANRCARDAGGRHPKRIVTTLGDLISAVYDASEGLGAQRLERAADLLTRSPLARCMSRQLHFVR